MDGKTISYYSLDIKVDGSLATFKQAAFSVEEAESKCREYFPGKTIEIVAIENCAKWEPEGFRK